MPDDNDASAEMMRMGSASGDFQQSEQDIIASVEWESPDPEIMPVETLLVGTLTVMKPIVGEFSFFIAEGVLFQIREPKQGGSSCLFSYRGPLAASFVKGIVKPGVTVFFSERSF